MTDSYRLIQDGQPVGTRQKAHTMIIEVLAEWGLEPRSTTPIQLTIATTEALFRAIKQIENLRQPTQSDALQADIDAMKSILWVDTIIDDQEAIAKAFARHRQYGYDQGYYDGQRDRPPTQSDALREALWAMPEPYEYLNKDQLKSIRPYVDALRNWKHRYRAVLLDQSE